MSEEYSFKDIKVIDLVSMNFIELISELEKRPSILPERTILCLDALIHGWLIGRGYEADNGIMNRFNVFIEKQYGVTTTHGWARIIHHYSTDGYDGLQKFFELFNQFLKTDSKNET